MARKSTRRRTRRRRQRGGADLKKGLVLAALIALGRTPEKVDALSLGEAYEWLQKSNFEEIHAMTTELVQSGETTLRELVQSGETSEKDINKAFEWYNEEAKLLPALLIPNQEYTLRWNKNAERVDGLQEGETVILKKIHDVIVYGVGDEDPGFYDVMRPSDVKGATEGKTISIPMADVQLECASETCALPKGAPAKPYFSPARGGRRRKTLRRRK